MEVKEWTWLWTYLLLLSWYSRSSVWPKLRCLCFGLEQEEPGDSGVFKRGLAVIRVSRCGVLHSSFCGKDEGGGAGAWLHNPGWLFWRNRGLLCLGSIWPGAIDGKGEGMGLSWGLQSGQVMQSSTGNRAQGCGRAYFFLSVEVSFCLVLVNSLCRQ